MNALAAVKNGLRTALYRCGVFGAWHRWRNRCTLTVLMFHRVLPANDPAYAFAEREFTFTLDGFRRTLDFVQRHYRVVSLDDLQATRHGQQPLPPTPLLITFDDGWRDTLTHAAPELARRGLPAVLFVPSEVVALKSPRWWQDALVAALAQPGAPARLSAAAGWAEMPKGSINQALAAHLGAMPEADRQAWLVKHAPGVLGRIGHRQMVTLGELKATDAGRFAIGGHGHTHSPLPLSLHPEAELQASQRLLDELGQGVRSMSFPHGAWSSDLAAAARRSGFDWVFTSDAALFDASGWPSPLLALGRIHVPENTWTCHAGQIDFARLATFLFFRPVQSTPTHEH